MTLSEERKYEEKAKEIPVFKNEDDEREFWSKTDSTDYIDWDAAEPVVFTKLNRDK